MAIKIREATGLDASELAKLLRLSDNGGDVRTNVSRIALSIDTSATERVVLACDQDELVGFAVIQMTESFRYVRSTAELTELFVKQSHRRIGIASMLVAAARQLCEDHHCMELYLRVNSRNFEAVQLYESCGLQKAKHLVYRFKYYGDPYE